MQLHGVVAGAAGHGMRRQALRGDGALPALLPSRMAGRGRGAHGLLRRLAQATARADGGQLGQHVAGQRVALRIAGRAQVQAEPAFPGTTLIEPFGTSSMPTVPTEPASAAARRSTYSNSSAAAVAASRRLPMGVVPAWLAMPWMRTR